MMWDLDEYGELLDAAAAYTFAHFDHEPQRGDLFLRHDIDLSLAAAVRMAELEAERGVSATYFVMTQSSFYDLESAAGEGALARLRSLGHRIGLHPVYPNANWDDRFDLVFAWHNPEPSFMTTGVDGLVNVMAPPWFDEEHYRSDSNQRWRHGHPGAALAANEFDWLHLLIHPEIWAYEGETMRETMASLVAAERHITLAALAEDRIDLS